MNGRFIVFEGGECSGKSTQAARLADRLGAVLTREPGATASGQALRALVLDDPHRLDARAEALVLAADRAQHVVEVIRPALAQGRTVVSDRFAGSFLAYQGFGRGLPMEDLRSLSAWAADGLEPDLVLLLDVPPDVAAQRMRRGRDRVESAGEDFHARVATGFRSLAAADPLRWVVVDGTPHEEAVGAEIDRVVTQRLGLVGPAS